MFELLFERQDGADVLRLAIAGYALFAGIAYLAFVAGHSSPIRAALKTSVVGVLSFLPLTYWGIAAADPVQLGLLTLALVLSAIGDLLLALRNQERFFVPGLASFLLAHVVFVAAFLPHASTPGALSTVSILVVAGAASILMMQLLPHLGRMRVPVIAYFTVIMCMVVAALSAREATGLLGVGAVLFAFSDSLIAVRKFLRPFPFINEAVWVTYCAAQFMITLALLSMLLPSQA